MDSLEWLLIFLFGALGLGVLGGTYLRRPGGHGLTNRFGCLLPAIGFGVVGTAGLMALVLALDGDVDLALALALSVPAVGLGLAVGYGFSRSDYGLGERGGYGVGFSSLVVALVLLYAFSTGTFNLGGVAAGPVPTTSPTSPGSTPTASATGTSTPATTAPATTAPATAAPATTAPPTAPPTASPTEIPIGQRSEFMDAFIELLSADSALWSGYMRTRQADEADDTFHASGQATDYAPGFNDIKYHVSFRISLDEMQATQFDTTFGCGTEDGFLVTCMPGHMRMGPGVWVVTVIQTMGPIGDLGPRGLVSPAVLFDSDTDMSTGFQADSQNPLDSFQGMTIWNEVYKFGNSRISYATDSRILGPIGFPERNNININGRFIVWPSGIHGGAEYVYIVSADDLYDLLYEDDELYYLLFYRPVIFGTANRNTFGANVSSMDIGEGSSPFEPFRVRNIRLE